MSARHSWWSYGFSLGLLVIVALVIARANRESPFSDAGSSHLVAPQRAATTSREGLQETIDRMERRLQEQPTDAAAAVWLADALLRQARVTGNSGLAVRAEDALNVVLRADPAGYDARRMLGAVYLSQHRFREAIDQAARARDQRPDDDWNYGVMGDGHLELGEYDKAFVAFQRMMDLRPTAGAYARAAYAMELRGNLGGAIEAMKLSTDATLPTDQESIAWHHAQLGDLYRKAGRASDAALEYAWADHSFPEHPFAARGMAELMEEAGDLADAARRYEILMARTPTPDVAERLGDVYSALGREADAARAYALAEAGWRFDAPHPAMLARFLADHDRSLPEALALAESEARVRHDIFTEDALAWCYFKNGRLDEAASAIQRAQRTGTKDRSLLKHAAAIEEAIRVRRLEVRG